MSDSIYNLGTARGTIELNASSLGRAEASLRSVGLGMIGLGAAALVGFGYVVKKSADFEQVMSGAQSALGATNVAKAIEQLAYAGLSVQEITGGAAKATIDLAQASGGLIDLDTAGRTVVNTMRTFGLSAKDAGHIADELAGAANKSTIDIEDMVTSLRYVGPVAHSAGLGLDDVSEGLAILGDRGIRGSTAGTSLRGVLIGLIAPSLKAQGVMKNLGIITNTGANIMFDASGKMKSLSQISQILQDKTRGLTAQQKEAAFAAIFQRRAMASALVLSEQGAAGFEHYRKEIAAGGSASDIAAVRLDNLKGDLKLLHSQLETVLIRAGTPFQNMLRGWVQGLTKVVEWFGRLSPHTQQLILKILAMTGVVLVAAGSFLYIAGTILKLYKTFKDLQAGIKLFASLFQALGIELLTNPIFLIIAVLVLLAVAFVILWVKFKGFRDFWKAAWRDIKGAAEATWRFLVRAFNDVRQWLEVNIPKALKKVKDAFSETGRFLSGVWNRVFGAISRFLEPFVGAVETAFASVKQAISTAVTFVGRQMTYFSRWFGKNVTPTLKAFGNLVAAIFKATKLAIQIWWIGIQPVFTAFKVAIQLLWGVLKPTFVLIDQLIRTSLGIWVDTFKLYLETLKNVWSVAWTIIKSTIQVTLLIISRILGIFFAVFLAVWHPFWHALVSVVQAVWTAIKKTIAAALQIIRGVMEVLTGLITLHWSKAWQGIKDIFGGVWKLILAVLDLAWKLMFTAIQAGISTVVNFFTTVPGKILSAIGDVTKLLWQKGIEVITSLFKGIVNEVSALWGWFNGINQRILDFFKGAGTWLIDVGKNIIKGLIHGITSMFGSLKNAAGGIAGKVIHWVNPPPAEGWLQPIGRKAVGGLITGITSAFPDLARSLGRISGMVSSMGSSGLVGAGGFGGGVGGVISPPGIGSGGVQVNVTAHPIVVEKGDTVSISGADQKSAEEIVNEYFWAKRVR